MSINKEEKVSFWGRQRFWRIVRWTIGTVIVLLVVGYLVVTSEAFVKGVILPKVGAAMNADLTASDAEVHPFSGVSFHNLKLTPHGEATLFTAKGIETRYSLWSIMRGNIVVENVTIDTPTITLVEHPNGTRNVDPLMATPKPATKPGTPAKSSAPPKIDVSKVLIKNATVRISKSGKDGSLSVTEISNFDVSLSNLHNGGTAKLDIAAWLNMKNTGAAANAGNFNATLNGSFGIGLTADLKPASLSGKTDFAVGKADGFFAELAGLAAALDCDVTPTDVKKLTLRFTQSGQALGDLRVSGPFDAEKLEGKLAVAVKSIDRRVLNLAGAASGMDFGSTTINSTNVVELAKGGSQISVDGQINVARFQVKKQSQITPTLNLLCTYGATVDRTAQSAQLKAFELKGTQDARPLLDGKLTSPMTISLGGAAGTGAGDAALGFTITKLDLKDWRSLAPDLGLGGVVNVDLKVLSQDGGKLLVVDLTSQLAGLAAKFGSNVVSGLNAQLTGHVSSKDSQSFAGNVTLADVTGRFGTMQFANYGVQTDFDVLKKDAQIDINKATVTLRAGATVGGNVNVAGNFNTGTKAGKLQVTIADVNQNALRPFIESALGSNKLTSIAINSSTTVNMEANGDVAVQADLKLANFNGRYGAYQFANYGLSTTVDVLKKGSQIEIHKLSGELHEAETAGGKFDMSGTIDSEKKAGKIQLNLVDINQNGLRPFLESALGDKKLVSIVINSTTTTSFEANGDLAIKTDSKIANLVVNDPKGSLPTTPLEARLQLDAGLAKNVAQIRQGELTLTPTERAKNNLNLSGTVDMTKSNAITGNLKLVAESLDVTRYYDIFGDKPKTATTTPAPGEKNPTTTSTTPPPAGPEKEPAPVILPLKNFVADVSIGKFYLREVEILDWKTTANLDGGHVVLKPFQLTLNGAPVKTDLDLDMSVPGYRYDLTFSALAVPVAPFVNSFQPERKGQIAGSFTATAQIKGAGVTGVSLQKNLSGQFGVLATNINLSISNVRSPIINVVIKVLTVLPDLIKNPASAVGGLLTSITGTGTKSSGWSDELTASPIQVVMVNGTAGNGVIKLAQTEIRSAAFKAEAPGDVKLADVLNDSKINIPVTLSLRPSLAEKIGYAAASTNAEYVALPNFLTVEGTVGNPKEKVDKLKVAAIAATGVGKNLGNAVGGQVGGLINAGAAVLGGGKPAPTTGTNQPAATATNAPIENVIRGIGDIFGGKKKK